MIKKPEIVLKNGKPAAVILDIRDYEKLLERLEDAHDLRLLRSIRKGKLKFRRLSEVMARLKAGV
jgi:PHD/YefM family antitoxin component YafN of YafNO toxin-antitoxin module